MNPMLDKIRKMIFGNPFTTLVAVAATIYIGFHFQVLTGPQIFQLTVMILGFTASSDGGKTGGTNEQD